jgi:Tol biopolymer transport system component/uncharacterized membrane protein
MTNNSAQVPIGIFLETSRYSVVEANKVEIPIVVVNLGNETDTFEITVTGVPAGWATLPASPELTLAKGESKRIFLKISPPPSTSSVAGEYLVRAKVIKKSEPATFKEVDVFVLVTDADEIGDVSILMDTDEYSAAPGSILDIPFVVHNQAEATANFELMLDGLPTGWASIPNPVILLGGRERRSVSFAIQVPPYPLAKAGPVPFRIQVKNQSNPIQAAESLVTLTVSAHTEAGRITLMMSTVQFQVAPGNKVEIPVVLLNTGAEDDQLTVELEGLPAGWVSTIQPVNLEPGIPREVIIRLHPPFAAESRAGRHVFEIIVASKLVPEEITKVECVLFIAAFSEFTAHLTSTRFSTGDKVHLVLANNGNTPQTFSIKWISAENALAAEALQPLPVPTGKAGAGAPPKTRFQKVEQVTLRVPQAHKGDLEFRMRLRSQPLFGSPRIYPMNVEIESAEKKTQSIATQVGGGPLFPRWLAVLAIVMTCAFLAIGIAYLTAPDPAEVAATQTSAATTQIISQTQTALYGGMDNDMDGLTNAVEAGIGTDPNNPDTDRDLLSDGVEYGTCANPLNSDSDGDKIIDGQDLNPCDPQNPSLTATAVVLLPTVTPIVPTLPSPTPTSTSLPPPPFRGEMLFSSNRDGSNPQIYNATGSQGQTLNRLTYSSGTDAYAAWSPDGRQIAFTSNRDGNNEIYVMDVNGSNLVNLTNNPASDQHPSWSTDGQWITFSTNRDGNDEIYVMAANGGQLKNLTNNPASDTMPCYGLLGSLLDQKTVIGFVSSRNGNNDIFIMTADGSNVVNLTNNPANDFAPAISTSNLIAFTSNRSGNNDVFIMNGDGTNAVNLTNNSANDSFPSFSPDNGWIAYSTDRDGNSEIYIIAANGLNNYNFTRNPAQDFLPAWR